MFNKTLKTFICVFSVIYSSNAVDARIPLEICAYGQWYGIYVRHGDTPDVVLERLHDQIGIDTENMLLYHGCRLCDSTFPLIIDTILSITTNGCPVVGYPKKVYAEKKRTFL